MKFGNKKGYGDIVVIVAMAMFSFLILKGPQLVASFGDVFSGGNKNQAKQVHTIDKTLYEVDPVTNKYKPIGTYKEMFSDTSAIKPPETLMEKFLGLGAWLLLIGGAITVFGAWPLVKKYLVIPAKNKIAELSASKDELRGDAQLIVLSVDEGLSAMNAAIAAAESTYNTTQATLKSAALITDAIVRDVAIKNAQFSVTVSEAVFDAVTDVKKEFLAALSRKQDTTTKLLVAELKND